MFGLLGAWVVWEYCRDGVHGALSIPRGSSVVPFWVSYRGF